MIYWALPLKVTLQANAPQANTEMLFEMRNLIWLWLLTIGV